MYLLLKYFTNTNKQYDCSNVFKIVNCVNKNVLHYKQGYQPNSCCKILTLAIESIINRMINPIPLPISLIAIMLLPK